MALTVVGLATALSVASLAPANAGAGFTANFELDKNTVDPAGAGADWDSVYARITADTNDTGDDDKCIALGAVECAFATDPRGVSIYTTGGSKDDLDISSWRHTTGSVPPKNEITNAYAAKYDTGGRQLLYFGADRFAVNGAADFGFWFFKSEVTQNADGTFTGAHTARTATSRGDILILGTFTQGGATSNIRVFEWVGTGGNATSNGTVAGPTGAFADCVAAAADANGCGTVNNDTITVAWPYEGKAGQLNEIPAGGFVEGGIDLTSQGLDGCFSTFIAETRSSPSVDAQLKDFVLGKFESCGSTLTTTPTNTSGVAIPSGGVSIGTGTVAVKDSAALAVSGASTWSGNVAFSLCKVAAPGLCDGDGNPTTTTDNDGTSVGSVAVNQGTAQPVLSPTATVTSAGRYCWRAVFTSATTGVPNATDSSATECFTVNPVTPELSTQAVAAAVNFGQAVQDNATLAGAATQPAAPVINTTGTSGAAAGGTIEFTLLKADCTTLATGTGTNPQSVTVSGNTTYGPVSFTPDAPGTYHWKARYIPATGDANNIGSTHNGGCTDSSETVVVNKAPTSIATSQSVYPNDSATVSVAAADAGTGNVAGSVKFRLYDTLANCQATTPSDTVGTGGLLYRQVVNLPGNQTSSTIGTTNTATAVSASSTVAWLVEFASDNQAQFGRNSVCTERTALTFTNDAGPGTAP